jgi:bifunctional DNA-binding transcriptional regulator/antitoxin component of YhaV-PrlF toxin-antitoxin module
MPRRKIKEKNIRKITKVGKKSYAVTLPIDIIRKWRWKEKQKVELKINEKKKTIIISDWEPKM